MKPNLLFFRRARANLPGFLDEHRRAQERCLEQHFTVTVITESCDFDEMCDRHAADAALIEVGVDSDYQRLSNVEKRPDIPKLGFLHADAWDAVRGVFIARMAELGVNDFVTHSVSLRDYTPEIADRTFVWSNFIETDVFARYVPDEEKIASILLTGSRTPLYPWRNAVWPRLERALPTTTSVHPGWDLVPGAPQAVSGVPYARLLSGHRFAAACGSMTKDIVRKHLEIPATGGVLVTEDTPAVRAFGFEDEVNCLFVTADDAVDKLHAVFDDLDAVARIAMAGYELVRSRHTIANRSQISEWYRLTGELNAGEKIVQHDVAGSLSIARPTDDRDVVVLGSAGVDRRLIGDGWTRYAAGNHRAALQSFAKARSLAEIPEAVVGAARSRLRLGDSLRAAEYVSGLLDVALGPNGASRPDPMQWALQVRVLICQGRLDAARSALDRFPDLSRPELEQLRWVVDALRTPGDGMPLCPQTSETQDISPTICPVPESIDSVWLADLIQALNACGYRRLAATLQTVADDSSRCEERARHASSGSGMAASDRLAGWRRRATVKWAIAAERAVRGAGRLAPDSLDAIRALSSGAARRIILVGLPKRASHRLLLRQAARRNPVASEMLVFESMDRVDPDLMSTLDENDLVYLSGQIMDGREARDRASLGTRRFADGQIEV